MSELPAIKILHVTPSLSRAGGGVTEAVWGMIQCTSGRGIRHSAVAMRDAWTDADRANVPPGCDVQLFAQQGPRSIFYSSSLGTHLQDSVREYDIVHVHSIRHWPGMMARRYALAAGRPLLISLHGALYPAALQRSPLRKAITHALFENATLRAADCLHATSPQEADFIRSFGCRNPIATIPLGVNPLVGTHLSMTDENRQLVTRWPPLANRRRLLFLGLLAPWKGLLRLIAAWSRLEQRFPEWQLVIAGPSVGDFEAHVRAEVSGANLAGRVTFLGPMYGEDKATILRHSDVLVLPSDQENFGLVVAEALSAALPAIASRTSPWDILEHYDCGWWIEPSVDALTDTLNLVLAQPPEALSQRGRRGKEIIARRFSWDAVGADMTKAYRWIAGRDSRPACVSGHPVDRLTAGAGFDP